MDTLSNILESVRFAGARFFQAEFGAPWSLSGSQGSVGAHEPSQESVHLVSFHFIAEGHCKIKLADDSEVCDADTGDLLLLPRSDRHVIGSDVHAVPLDPASVFCQDEVGGVSPLMSLRHGGRGDVTKVISGYLVCSRDMMRPLFEALPRLVHIPGADGHSVLIRDLLQIGRRAAAGARQGADSTLARVADILFVEALRRYAEVLPTAGKGWFSALSDARIGRALALMHEEPERAWTLEELARRVALSRSALADRFAALVGEPPMHYLTRWRLSLAARALRSGAAIVRVAEQSGYESDTSFSRAFKREFGMSPAVWRRCGERMTGVRAPRFAAQA